MQACAPEPPHPVLHATQEELVVHALKDARAARERRAVRAETANLPRELQFREAFNCAVCHDLCIDAMSPECGHLFCTTCLLTAALAGSDKVTLAADMSGFHLHCPVCRVESGRVRRMPAVDLIARSFFEDKYKERRAQDIDDRIRAYLLPEITAKVRQKVEQEVERRAQEHAEELTERRLGTITDEDLERRLAALAAIRIERPRTPAGWTMPRPRVESRFGRILSGTAIWWSGAMSGWFGWFLMLVIFYCIASSSVKYLAPVGA